MDKEDNKLIEIPVSENQYIEFKSEAVKAMPLAEEIVAFANSEGGEIWLGVEDDRTISGLSKDYEEDVMNICRTCCIPPIQVQYETYYVDNKRIACLQIPKGKDKPYYTTTNKYFIRVGSTKRIASHGELLRLFQASGAFHFDLTEVEKAKVTDLDIGQIGNYFTRYHISFFDEAEEERIRIMKYSDIMSENGIPTLAGILMFGLAPERFLYQSGISFAHFSNTDMTADLIDKKNISAPLPQLVDNAVAVLKNNLMVSSTIIGNRRVEGPGYSDKVFRELIVNACVHRNYSISGSQIRLFLFKDRLEVISPGRLPNTVSIEKLPIGTSVARNPALVRFMENLGYVDKLGRGLPMVCREVKELGKKVEFMEKGEEFKVILTI